jgi:ubiquinone/menaquinone biosynthesis C-methylase UbiE
VTGVDESDALWEQVAGWWQENFTEGADPEYEEQILPLALHAVRAARRVLEVGTGEGQVARFIAAAPIGDTRATDRLVVGLDLSAAQIVEAHRRGGGPSYTRGRADLLPFADASFDAVVACLVFEHIDAVDAAIAEVARVLEPGGTFAFFLNHPLLQTPDSGWIDDQILDPPEQYWRIGSYLEEASTMEQVEKGVFIRFVHRPLSRYVNAMAAAGLFVEHMDEPAPPTGFLARAPEYVEAATIPRLLLLRARKLSV